jgi:lipid II:glycine glycyltransferase (peptidoglycan interpeptide bridge formation enzyme)
MLITERKFGVFTFVNVYFAEEPGTAEIPDCDVVTYHTYKNWGDIKGFDRIQYLVTKIDLSQDIDEIWNKIKRQHKRHIRRADKNGTTVTANKNYEKFHQIYKNFFKQKNYADPSGLNILSSQFMQKCGILFIAEKQGEIKGGNFYFYDEHNACLVDSAYQKIENTIENKKQSTDANCYLHWEAMKFFKNMGIINYDFGDVSWDDININHQMDGGTYFKRSFGGEVVPRYEYRKFNSRFSKLLFHAWNFLRMHA